MSLEENDTVTTIGEGGQRVWLYPIRVLGRFVKARYAVSWLLMSILIAAPWIDINGHPSILLDMPHRRFYLFGMTLFATNGYYLLFLAGLVVFSVFLFTATLGRAWCGWTCPQTVFLESYVRVIEEWIEGKPSERKRLDAAPWGVKKLTKKFTKWSLFLALAGAISTTTVAYFIGREGILEAQFNLVSFFVSIKGPISLLGVTFTPQSHPVATGIFLFLMGLLMFDFLWFREQVCLIVCPYGRFQSVLMDESSLSVWYDPRRGEPRGKPKKTKRSAQESHPEITPESTPLGDCIDCNKCVQVCPTGIDIRKGSQLECVQCAACIDACDSIMDKLKRPRGLIRYTTEAELEGREPRYLRPRVIAYVVALLIVVGALITTVRMTPDLELRATRMAGAPFEVLSGGLVKNAGRMRVTSHLTTPSRVKLTLAHPSEGLQLITPLPVVEVAGGGVEHIIFFLMHPQGIANRSEVRLRVIDAESEALVGESNFTFLAPERNVEAPK